MSEERFWLHVSCRNCDWQAVHRLREVAPRCPACGTSALIGRMLDESIARRLVRVPVEHSEEGVAKAPISI